MLIQDAIRFIQEIDKLKSDCRKTLNYNQQREENTAEHSWHLAMSVIVFKDFSNFPNLDLLKAIKLALVHDIVEIDAGDVIVYKEDPEKYDREKKAAERIFGLLPQELSKEFHALWEEFEAKKTPEAQFVNALDRFLPMMSNHLNGGHTWKKFNVNHAQVLAKNQKAISSGSEELWKMASEMLEKSIAQGDLNR
ncbi:MAG: HD domain-containing protein [Bdellovibrionales bacterium]